MADNVGIYKITSPSGKVYIGQSWNIKNRFQDYRGSETKRQPKLNHSFLKYGAKLHRMEVIHALPIDISQGVLDMYEGMYMLQYKNCGVELMNTKEAGSKGKHSEETKKKLKIATAKTQYKKGHIPWIKGIGHSNEVRENQRERMIGKESPMKGKKHSEEVRLNMSLAKKGKPSPRIGIKCSDEIRARMSVAQKGTKRRPRSEEHLRKISIAKKGVQVPKLSKKVVCTKTGIIYQCVQDAADSIGVKRRTLVAKLGGFNNNNTTLKYYIY